MKISKGRQRPRKPKFTSIDLFSGCGGLSTGLRRAGFRIILAVDVDPLATACYRMNHKRTHLWQRNISSVTGKEIRKTLGLVPGALDLLAGCPPCQGFSSIRTLNGARNVGDPRNDLVTEFSRLAIELKPKAILMENVPGLELDARFDALLARLHRNGYKTNWGILDASNYGVPQRRRRLILLAGLDGQIELPKPATKRKSVLQALGNLPQAGLSGDPAHDHLERRNEKVAALIRRIPKDGGSRTDLPDAEQLECHKRTRGFNDVYGRMRWNDISPTITSGFVNPSKGRFIHPTHDRTITLREGALLQSFPKNYRFPVEYGKFPVAALIGNAVPPLFATAQARSIRNFLESISLME
jgi:DNA (cytosine-5)-methyltransferase 1